jgi:hypothetical protein
MAKFDPTHYMKFQSLMLFIYTIIMTFGIVIYMLDFGIYGQVIFNETSQWSKGVITDIQPANGTACPSNY